MKGKVFKYGGRPDSPFTTPHAMFTAEQFDRTRRLALNLAGIELVERHRELLDRRCRRLAILDSASVEALLKATEDGDPAAGQQFASLVTTKFTGFFRHPSHFEVAARLTSELVCRNGRARLWSAGVATGEEAYSLAMAVREAFGCAEPRVTILATDINEEALAVARRGQYRDTALGTLTSKQRTRFFRQCKGKTWWHLVPDVQGLVEFRALNLMAPAWPIGGQFDVIFCRNVLMYLEAGCRRTVLERIASLLTPEGLLFIDPVEHPGPAGKLFVSGENGIYSRRPVSPLNGWKGRSSAHRIPGPSL